MLIFAAQLHNVCPEVWIGANERIIEVHIRGSVTRGVINRLHCICSLEITMCVWDGYSARAVCVKARMRAAIDIRCISTMGLRKRLVSLF